MIRSDGLENSMTPEQRAVEAKRPKLADAGIPPWQHLPSGQWPKGVHNPAREQQKDIIIVSLMQKLGVKFHEVPSHEVQQNRMIRPVVDEDTDDRVSVMLES